MTSIKIAGFEGAAAKPHAKLLLPTIGVDSRNQKPGHGDLRPWSQPLQVATVPAGRSTIYRMGRDTPSDGSYWLSFIGQVHLARGQIGSDTTERTYYTGDGIPKYTDNLIGLASAPYPSAWRQLGVPVPVNRPTVAVATAGEADQQETLFYVYTFVTDQGEESAPSPVSADLRVNTDATLTISGIDSPPAGAFTITRIRIYRTQSTDVGAAAFFFLREIAAGISSTTDDRRALGEAIPTVGWQPPPADLSWLTAMWNGMFAGISGNGVRFCVAYSPYAWPLDYETTTPDAKPVALAVMGQSLLVLTTAKPVLVAGTGPESLDSAPLEFGQACVAPRSVVSLGDVVIWASPDGLAAYGSGGARLLTEAIFSRKQWQQLNPATMVASRYEGFYFCNYTDSQGIRRAFLIDGHQPGGVLYLDKGYDAVWFDELQDALYVLDGVNVLKWDAGAAAMTARFVSKVFVTAPGNLGWGRVVADAYPVQLQIDAGPLPADALARLVARAPARLAAAGPYLRYTVSVPSNAAFRLPDGFLASEYQVAVQSAYPVQGVVLASGASETVS